MFVSQIFDEASEILATTDKTKVFRKLTQAVQILMESGHYFHTTQEVDVCTGWDGQTITLPRGIEVPLGVNVDGSPTYFRDRLFQYHVNKGGMYNPVDWAWDDRGFVATVMDIRQPSQLVAVSEHSSDAGKLIRVIGTDSNNRPLRTQMPDGTTVDGMLVSVHAQGDFPLGTVEPDGVTIQTREVKINPLTQFVSSSPHQLQSGQSAVLTAVGGAIPSYLLDGNTYFIGVDDNNTIQLYNSQLDAKSNSNPIYLQSVLNTTSVKLTDSRTANLNTVINFQSVPPVTIDSPNELVFTVGTGTGFSASLPSPIVAGATYFGQSLDSQNIAVYPSILDAQNKTNQVELTGTSGKFNTDIRKQIAPETLLTFAIQHYFKDGDQVQAYTSGGNLPTPLIAGQNYYAHVIDDYTISLHTTAEDAIASTGALVNPIIFSDSGTGINSIVKLLPATATTGSTSQITAPGLQIAPPQGSGAQFQAVVTGAVISVTVSAGGSKYTSAPSVTFSDPPTPPTGSGQIVYPATGYAVMAPDAVASTTYQVASIVLTSSGLGYTSRPSVIIGAAPSGGTNASANATIQTSFVSSFKRISGGFGYTQPPQVKISGGGGSGATANATINTTTNIVPAGNLTCNNTGTATCVIPTGHGYLDQQTVQISGANLIGGVNIFNKQTAVNVPDLVRAVQSLTGTIGTQVITATFSSAHSYSDGQEVTFYGAAQAEYNVVNASITVLSTTQVQYTSSTFLTVATATGTLNSKIPNPTTFTYPVTSATAQTATGNITTYSGNVTSVTVVTQGTNYTSTPSVTLTPSTGVFVEFSATGSLPAPLVAGTAYRAEAPLNTASGRFTVVAADFSPITITSSATGNFYCVLSRPFGIGFNNSWYGDFAGVSTGQEVYLGSDYLLPNGVNNTTKYYISKINNNTVDLYTNSSLTNRATVSTVGTGQAYFAIRMPSYARSYNNIVSLDNTQFLINGGIVQFDSTGSLPFPLTSNTDYKIILSGRGVNVTTMAGVPIVFENSGIPTLPIGQMSMNIIREFAPVISTSIVCDASIFEIGEQVSVRPNGSDSLPNGLVQSTMASPQFYYARPIGSGVIELYDTRQHALNTQTTTGRVEYKTSGDNVSSTFFADSILPPILVKSVQHIDKPETLGYVSLYALDYGRSNDMALIGQYHPTELNPKYRRIRIGKPCAWARIIYRVTHPTITSVYDYIPLENERAIIAAVHACDLEDKDFMEQAQKYWAVAINYLKNQNESMEDHAMKTPQVNNITYGDYTDDVMF